MKLNELADSPKARHAKKRRGQGVGSGLGKTSGRGQKGYKSRSGATLNGFEGGQTPIHMRTPKRGFSNRAFEKSYAVVTTRRLQEAADKGVLEAGAEINGKLLKEKGIIRRLGDGLRIIGDSELKAPFNIEATGGVSAGARKVIEAAGGSVKTEKAKAAAKKEAPEAPTQDPAPDNEES